jgi:type IV pilus assembly protein PilQ
VSNYGTVDLAVQDTDLAQVLQMLSIQSRKNIITSKSVSATVTANLYDVTFHEALDSILRVNGYGYIEEGNFIYIYTQEELEEIKKSMRETVSRIFELDYLSAGDANEFITPLLSESGQSSNRGEVTAGFKPDVNDGGADSYAFTAKLVVNDYPEVLEAVAALLDELDTPPHQVLVEATVMQTVLDESNAWGVDFSYIADLSFTDLTNPLSAVANILAGSDAGSDIPATADEGFEPGDNSGQAVVSTPGNTSGPGTLKFGIIEDDFSLFLKVLDEVTDTTVLARPKIMALNRQRAEVLVGARVGYLSTTSTQTTTTQTVQFLDTGIQLVFRPFVSKDGMIRMELKPSVSEASLRTVTDSNGLLVTIPDELTNEMTTNVRVRDGHTLVLGGLFRESTRISRRQVPLLGDIPIIGAVFQGNDDTVDRDEIIFLITPSIVKDQLVWDLGNEMSARVEAVQVGARAGLLPFSRDKMTGNYNNDAMEAFRAGNTKRALYFIGNSLRLNPNQPEMIALREQISGVRAQTHERSLMERVFQDRVHGPRPGAGGSTFGPRLFDRSLTPFAPADLAEVDRDDE